MKTINGGHEKALLAQVSPTMQALTECAADPMWANHAEVSKALLTRGALVIGTVRDSIPSLYEAEGALSSLVHEDSPQWLRDALQKLRDANQKIAQQVYNP